MGVGYSKVWWAFSQPFLNFSWDGVAVQPTASKEKTLKWWLCLCSQGLEGHVSFILILLRLCITKRCWSCQIIFLNLLRWSGGVFPFILFICCIALIDFELLNKPCVPGINSFLYTAEFSLVVCCLGFVPLYSWGVGLLFACDVHVWLPSSVLLLERPLHILSFFSLCVLQTRWSPLIGFQVTDSLFCLLKSAVEHLYWIFHISYCIFQPENSYLNFSSFLSLWHSLLVETLFWYFILLL